MKVRSSKHSRLAGATRLALVSLFLTTLAHAQQAVAVSDANDNAHKKIGAPMTIGDIAAHSKEHKVFVTAVKAAGLWDLLAAMDAHVLLAPTNAAFETLPAGLLETMLKPENKAQLVKLLLSHVVSSDALDGFAGGRPWPNSGVQKLTSASGALLWVTVKDGNALVQDENGTTAKVTVAFAGRSRGPIFGVNHVLQPRWPVETPSGWTLVQHDQTLEKRLP